MTDLEEIVHIIPLGYEYDRAVRVFEEKPRMKANRVYLISSIQREVPSEIRERHEVYLEKVGNRLEELGIDVETIAASLIDLLDIMRKVSTIISKEKKLGNIVYINMSAAGRMTSVGATLAGMVHGARVYYVESDGYADSIDDWEKHGLSIVTHPRIRYLKNFEINLPTEEQQRVLVRLYEGEKLSSYEIIKFLVGLNVKNFDVDLDSIDRKERTRITMMLNRSIMDKLVTSGYVKKERNGKETVYSLTESGEYVACISGLDEIGVFSSDGWASDIKS